RNCNTPTRASPSPGTPDAPCHLPACGPACYSDRAASTAPTSPQQKSRTGMSNFDYDPGDTPTADPRTEQEPARVDRVGLPPGTGSLNPSALETHARAALQDRQRLLRDLGGTGSLRRSARLDEAPPALKQFLRGEVDLDSELARRFARSPLLTAIARSPQDTRHATQATAMLNSQDGSAMLSFDLYAEHEATEVTFTLSHMLALRFRLVGLSLY